MLIILRASTFSSFMAEGSTSPRSPLQPSLSVRFSDAALKWAKKEYENEVTYRGEFSGRKWHGYGKLEMKDGEEYQGQWSGIIHSRELSFAKSPWLTMAQMDGGTEWESTGTKIKQNTKVIGFRTKRGFGILTRRIDNMSGR